MTRWDEEADTVLERFRITVSDIRFDLDPAGGVYVAVYSSVAELHLPLHDPAYAEKAMPFVVVRHRAYLSGIERLPCRHYLHDEVSIAREFARLVSRDGNAAQMQAVIELLDLVLAEDV